MKARRSTDPLFTVAVLLLAAPLIAIQPASDPASLAAFAGTLQSRIENLETGTGRLQLTLLVPDASSTTAQALFAESRAALSRLDAWLGPLPVPAITVIDAPWPSGLAGASYPGTVVTSTRWWSTSLDEGFERPLLAALARQYTLAVSNPGDAHAPFEEGLALYLGTRLIHDQFEGRYAATARYFGGMVPFSIRSIMMSPSAPNPRPPVARLPDVERPGEAPWRAAPASAGGPALQIASALHTFERVAGWPAFQPMLAQFMQQYRGRSATPAEFVAAISEVNGSDLSWFFDEAFRPGNRFDYAVSDLRAERTTDGVVSTVVVRRAARGLFAANGLTLVVRLEDGTEIREPVNGRAEEQSFVYRGTAGAVFASVDPGAVLLLDGDRGNNTRSLEPRANPLGVRLALNWVMWVQDALLTYASVL